MNIDHEPRDGICILSFDNGGPGTYSQLLIIKEYMSRLAYDLDVSEDDIYPADYFDWMGGVGFGGLVALMLGHFRMNVNQAIDNLVAVALAVFPDGPQQIPDPERNSRNLKGAIGRLLQARNLPLDTKMNDRRGLQSRCKVVLYAATKVNITHPHIFRTYSYRGSSFNPTIVEAICATISISSHFSPVAIGMLMERRNFVGGPPGANNPTRELIKEAHAVFGDEKSVSQLISIGCGIPHILSLEAVMNKDAVGGLLREMAADCHKVAQELSSRLIHLEEYRRFNVENGVGDIGFDDWSHLGDIDTHTRIYVAVSTVTNAIDASLRCLKSRVGDITFGQLSRPISVKIAAKTAPAVSSHFVLREKLWAIMVHHLVALPSSRQIIFPITGMGGCGKTQMASYFLQEYSYLFTQNVFVDAFSAFSIKSDIQTWARTLGDGHEGDAWEDGVRILSSVPQDERWTLILDCADDPKLDLRPFIPKNTNLAVIITSRNPDIGNLSTTYHLDLGKMEEDEALATLLRAARCQAPLNNEEINSARAIIQKLGYLPLSVVQVGRYCYNRSSVVHGLLQPYTFTQYLALFYAHRAVLMKNPALASLDRYQRGVYIALGLSYQAIPQASREFLHFLSYFLHTDIPLSAFAASAKHDFADSKTCLERPASHLDTVSDLRRVLCPDGAWNELQVQGMIRTLRSFDLVSTTSIANCIFIHLHPLIQAWSRNMVSLVSQRYRAMVIQILASCSREADFSLNRYLLPHILDTLGQINTKDLHVNDLVAVGEILGEQRHYHRASVLIEEATEKMTRYTGATSEATLMLTERLASLYWNEGRLAESEKLKAYVLEERRRLLGMEHPDATTAAANLASTYQSQSRLNAAEKLKLAVPEQPGRLLGMEHSDAVTAAAKPASTYLSQGRSDEAEKLGREQRRKLRRERAEERRKASGMEHLDAIGETANLASTYLSQGRLDEAERLRTEVLKQYRRVLFGHHPLTVKAEVDLASMYESQGRWGEAEKLWVDVLEQRRKHLGTDHPNTIRAVIKLALTYCEQGGWADAQTLQLNALKQLQTIFGSEHPDTIAVGDSLIATYNEQEKWEEAVELQVDLLEAKRRMLGDEHPRTISALAALASTYHFRGQLGAAEKLGLQVLYQRRIAEGENHPYTILASESLRATRSLRQESKFARQQISTMFLRKDLAKKGPKQLPSDVVKEPCLWYYETIPLSNPTGEGSIVHKGHSYCLSLVPLNLQLSETSILISKNTTFSEISSKLYSVEESTLPVALEQTGGPYPRWRIPKPTTKVPRGLQRIYIADISRPFTLALVRNVGGDIPLLIDMPSLKIVGKKTVGNVISGALKGRGRTWSSIKLLSGPGDIQKSSYTLIQKQTGSLYSTIFFVLMNDDRLAYNFRSDEECMGPLPLRTVFFQSRHLVDSAPRMMVLTLPAIHLSRALHHLIICLAEAIVMSKVEETMGAYFISRLNSLVSKLKAAFQKIEDQVDDSERTVRQSLIQFFYELCEEQPGVVAVRQSFESFKLFVLDGLGDTMESEYFPANSEILYGGALEEPPLKRAEGPSNPRGRSDSTGSCDSSTSYDGDSSVESVERFGPLEAAGDRQDAILDSETAPSIPTWLIEEHQRTIERVRLWYDDSGPLAKEMNEERTLSITGHSYRVQLVALNFELSQTSMMVDRNSTFSHIGFQLKKHNAVELPVALEQINGPMPRWRIPDLDSRVPRGLQKIYVVDVSEPFTVALVRDVKEDFPFLLSISSFNDGTTTLGDLIGARLDGRAKSWASIKLLSGLGDIQGLPCETVQKEIKGVYSTTILVHLADDPLAYKFRNVYDGRVPPPLQVAFTQCRSLVESAPRLRAFAFQAIDFSRALLHLAICLAEAIVEEKIEGALQVYLIARLKSMVIKLRGIFTDIENSTDNLSPSIAKSLHLFFYQLCEEQPGVVAVRQSLESLQSMIALDPQNQGSASGIAGMSALVRQEDSVEQDRSLLPIVTSGDPSGLDDSTSSDSLSSSDHESS